MTQQAKKRPGGIFKQDRAARTAWGQAAYAAIPKSVFALAAWHLANVASDAADSDGMGPSHGSIIFAVGLTNAARKRPYADLAPAEIEAAIYYLTNLARVQAAEADAKAKAAA